jgi:hypothetical protein
MGDGHGMVDTDDDQTHGRGRFYSTASIGQQTAGNKTMHARINYLLICKHCLFQAKKLFDEC